MSWGRRGRAAVRTVGAVRCGVGAARGVDGVAGGAVVSGYVQLTTTTALCTRPTTVAVSMVYDDDDDAMTVDDDDDAM